MKHQIKIIYLDEKEVTFSLHETKIEEFFAKIKSNEVFWTEKDKASGLWISPDKVRYIQFLKIEEKETEDAEVSEVSDQVIQEESIQY